MALTEAMQNESGGNPSSGGSTDQMRVRSTKFQPPNNQLTLIVSVRRQGLYQYDDIHVVRPNDPLRASLIPLSLSVSLPYEPTSLTTTQFSSRLLALRRVPPRQPHLPLEDQLPSRRFGICRHRQSQRYLHLHLAFHPRYPRLVLMAYPFFPPVLTITGDGDCFYRAFSLAYFLLILDSPNPAREADKALEKLESLKPLLLEAGFQELVVRLSSQPLSCELRQTLSDSHLFAVLSTYSRT